MKPLLDALSDTNVSQQRIAIEVLAYVQNKGAGPALFNYATGTAERELRVRAMIACGALNDTALLPRYEAVLAPGGSGLAPGDAVAVAATWGVARLGHKKAEPLLSNLLGSSSPEIRAIAAIGLGLSKNSAHGPALAKLARSPEAGPNARAAAAHALGELGHKGMRPLLLALTDSSEMSVRTAAVLALAQLGGSISADVGSIYARALLGDQPELRKTAMAAATAHATGKYRRETDALAVPNGAIAIGDVLRGLAPTGYSPDEQAKALGTLQPALTKAALAAVATSPSRASVVAELTLDDLQPLVDHEGGKKLSPTSVTLLGKTAEAIAKVSITGFVALTRHPSVEIRKRAVEFLAQRDEKDALNAVMKALDPSDPAVCKAALSALGAVDSPEIVDVSIKLLKASSEWSIRSHAASALGRLAKGSTVANIEAALEKAVQVDEFALVREAALMAAVQRGGPVADRVRSWVTQNEQETRLKKIAEGLAPSR